MNTFKFYMKIAWQNKIMLLLYVIILLTLTIIEGTAYEDNYSKTEINVGIIKEEESNFSNSLISYLNQDNNLYYYDSVKMAELDLYTRFIDGILLIPEGAERILLEEKTEPLSVYTDITNPQSRLLISITDKFGMYYKSMNNANELDLNRLSEILNVRSNVEFLQQQEEGVQKFFGFANAYGFVIMMVLFNLLGSLNLTFNKKEILIRNYVSPKSQSRINLELNLAQLLIAILIFIFVTIFVIVVLFRNILQSSSLIYYMSILGLWTLIVVFISAFVNQLAATKTLSNMISNALPVMLMFISGSAIPIEMMPDFVANIAKFSPLYYYNEAIKKISAGNFLIGNEVLILISFGIAFYITSIYIGREKGKTNI